MSSADELFARGTAETNAPNALRLLDRAIGLQRKAASSGDPDARNLLGRMLTNRVGNLQSTAHCEEALSAIEEAVTLRRTLVAEGHDRFRSYLANGLTIRAQLLYLIDPDYWGRIGQAVDEAVDELKKVSLRDVDESTIERFEGSVERLFEVTEGMQSLPNTVKVADVGMTKLQGATPSVAHSLYLARFAGVKGSALQQNGDHNGAVKAFACAARAAKKAGGGTSTVEDDATSTLTRALICAAESLDALAKVEAALKSVTAARRVIDSVAKQSEWKLQRIADTSALAAKCWQKRGKIKQGARLYGEAAHALHDLMKMDIDAESSAAAKQDLRRILLKQARCLEAISVETADLLLGEAALINHSLSSKERDALGLAVFVGQPFSRVFQHARGLPDTTWRIRNSGVHGVPEDAEETRAVLVACQVLDIPVRRSWTGSPVNATTHDRKATFLDGGIEACTGDYMFSSRGAWIGGAKAALLIALTLGLTVTDTWRRRQGVNGVNLESLERELVHAREMPARPIRPDRPSELAGDPLYDELMAMARSLFEHEY